MWIFKKISDRISDSLEPSERPFGDDDQIDVPASVVAMRTPRLDSVLSTLDADLAACDDDGKREATLGEIKATKRLLELEYKEANSMFRYFIDLRFKRLGMFGAFNAAILTFFRLGELGTREKMLACAVAVFLNLIIWVFEERSRAYCDGYRNRLRNLDLLFGFRLHHSGPPKGERYFRNKVFVQLLFFAAILSWAFVFVGSWGDSKVDLVEAADIAKTTATKLAKPKKGEWELVSIQHASSQKNYSVTLRSLNGETTEMIIGHDGCVQQSSINSK